MIEMMEFQDLGDYHTHFRENGMMREVAPFHSPFAHVLAMPNLTSPVATASDVAAYQKQLKGLLPDQDILMTIKLLPNTKPSTIKNAHAIGVAGAKLYTLGTTTGSEDGFPQETFEVSPALFLGDSKLLHPESSTQLMECFEEMQHLDMPWLVHGEMPNSEVMDAEADFLGFISYVYRRFPRLRIVMEHITTEKAVNFVLSAYQESCFGERFCRLVATITAHHLYLTHSDILRAKLRPWNYCMPVAKYLKDLKALVKAATSGLPCFIFGSDNAPHTRQKKECIECCAGIWSAPTMIPAVIDKFVEVGAQDKLQGFLADNGLNFYGRKKTGKITSFVREKWNASEEVMNMTPFLAKQTLGWQLAKG